MLFKNKSEVVEEIKLIISTSAQIDLKEISLEADFNETLGIDSLGTLELIGDLEQKFNIQFESSEEHLITSLASVADLIWNKLKANNASTIEDLIDDSDFSPSLSAS